MPSTTATTSPLTASSEKKRLPDSALVFLTGGDPAGISPEIVRRTLTETGVRTDIALVYLFTAQDFEEERLRNALAKRTTIHDLPTDTAGLDTALRELAVRPDGALHLLNVARKSGLPGCDSSPVCETGRPGPESGRLAFRALHLACMLISKHGCRGLVTAPLSKEWVARSGVQGFSGHTGYLSGFFHSRVVMLMHGRQLSVIPLTEHVALRDVSRDLRELLTGAGSAELIEILTRLAKTQAFREKGVALCALNPHAGEGGLIGNEEGEYLVPFLKELRNQGLRVDGPLPADTLFMPEIRQKYRLVLAGYHDQGLIPFKALEAADGINVTVGLPFLRTSPDHGTAYGIAGQEAADITSMWRALETAYGGVL